MFEFVIEQLLLSLLRGGAGDGALVLRQQNEVSQVTGPRAADLKPI